MLAWMLIKSCIKCDFHFSFPTRIRSYFQLFWFHIARTGVDIDMGQVMTGLQDFITKSPILSLPQCNPELVTEII